MMTSIQNNQPSTHAWYVLFTLLLTCLVSQGLLGAHIISAERLDLRQSAFSSLELWRLFSAHFIHSNAWHLALNLGGLVITWVLFVNVFTVKRLVFVMIVCTLGLSCTLLLFSHLNAYLGLSGTLHGLFAFALVLELKQKRLSTYALILIGLAKLIYEQLGGSNEQTAELIGISVAIDGHLYGAILGVISALTCLANVHHKGQKKPA